MLIFRIYCTVQLANSLSKKDLFLLLQDIPGAGRKEREKRKKHGFNPGTIEICECVLQTTH